MMFLHGHFHSLILLSIISSSTAANTEYVLGLAYQSKGIPFSEWVSLFTLCLAPLAVHIFAGVPSIVRLSSTTKTLSWPRRFCHYNPTTITWRYFAIADRRCRAKTWSTSDMAASNALFWTSQGWDGSEAMIVKSQSYCLKLPKRPWMSVLSKTSAQTIVVTIQGAQAISSLVGGLVTKLRSFQIALDTIFFPLAILGLVRLFAALWLTDDYFYAEHEQFTAMLRQEMRTSNDASEVTSRMRLLSDTRVDYGKSRLYPVHSWRGILFRIAFGIPILLLWILCFVYMLPFLFFEDYGDSFQRTPTVILVIIFYMFLLTATLFIYAGYSTRSHQDSTIIPCLESTWYQIYTGLLMLMMVILIIVAAISTRKATCGTYTTYAPLSPYGDEWMCGGSTISPNSTTVPFGLVMRYANLSNPNVLPVGEYTVVEWNGWCSGSEGPSQHVIAINGTGQAI